MRTFATVKCKITRKWFQSPGGKYQTVNISYSRFLGTE
jgi:hypothetical protein